MQNIYDKIIIFRALRYYLSSITVFFFKYFSTLIVLLKDCNFNGIRVPENTLNHLASWREQRRQSVETNFRGVTRPRVPLVIKYGR